MLSRRHQILTKLEPSDGAAATPGAGDAVLVFEPSSPADDVAFLDRVPAGASLSRENTPPGLTTRSISWKEDFRGSGTPGTAPSWGKHLLASLHRTVTVVQLDIDLFPVTTRFAVGELVSDGVGLGVCLTDVSGVTSASMLVAVITGTFGASGTLGGFYNLGSATIEAKTDPAAAVAYMPESERIVQWSSGAWAATTPSGVGVILEIKRGGFVVGALQVVELGTGSSWVAGVKGQMVWGTLANGDVLVDSAGHTATLSADPTQIRGASLSIHSNLDGFLRKVKGSRGDFTLEGQAGEPLQFSFNFRGAPNGDTAALAVTTTGLGAIRSPRLFGAFVGIGYGAQFRRFPLHSLSLTPGNVVGDRPDVNAPGGTQGTNIGDRDPVLTIVVDEVGKAFDWIARQANEENVYVGAVLGGDGTGSFAGRTAGNTNVLAAPNCQVAGIQDGDTNGTATKTITLKPRRVPLSDAGNDEYVLASF